MSESSKFQILERYRSGKLAHAILLDGNKSSDKMALACGVAAEILQSKNAANPDLLIVEKEEGKKEINVEKIRAIADFANQTSASSGKKIVIINSACELNRSAANAILKILEEPSANSFFILISNNLSKVLPTIRSRCQLVKIPHQTFESFSENLRKINGGIAVSEIEILSEICDNSVESVTEFGLDSIGFYQSFLDAILQEKIDAELAKKIADKNFNFAIFAVVFEFFANRLMKFSAGAKLNFLADEEKVFNQLFNKFSAKQIFVKLDESLISLRKTTPLSLNKSLSFINIFNQFTLR